MHAIKVIILFAAALLLLQESADARQAGFEQANRLMQQQNYEEAKPILESLFNENPSSFTVYERYMEVLLNLNELEKAEETARRQIGNNRFILQSSAKLGEVLHLQGKREEALKVWMEALEQNPQNIQAAYTIGSVMVQRREYDEAIAVYSRARDANNNPTLFLNEMANTYMQAGNYEKSVHEYYRLILEAPRQMAIVQQRFFQMRDERLFSIASFELEDLLLDLSPSDEGYAELYQLLSWLLIETEEFTRAYNFARHYEQQTGYSVYSLFSLGNQFTSANQYSYAEQAFQYYLESPNLSTRFRAMDELSHVYLRWARYAEQNSLASADSIRHLYEQSYSYASGLLEEHPSYERSVQVASRLIDLSLDTFHDFEQAEKWLGRMKELEGASEAYRLYAEGRLAIYNQNFSTARHLFARADRATDNTNLSEQIRYYSSLSDFFAGDFEFAGIQLRSLERRHASWFANNAIKLRMWIQKGVRADTTGALMKQVAEGIYRMHTGNFSESLEILEPILENAGHPFSADMAVEVAARLPGPYSGIKLKLIERHAAKQEHSPLRERLLWEHARLAEQFLLNRFSPPSGTIPLTFLDDVAMPEVTAEDVEELYEKLILEFPGGFYAPYAREKLQQFQSGYL